MSIHNSVNKITYVYNKIVNGDYYITKTTILAIL